jgi:hypothetical protein
VTHNRTPAPATLYEADHRTQQMCVNMHRNGFWIDEVRRKQLVAHFEKSVEQRRTKILSLLDKPNMSPGSDAQVRDLLYEEWGLGIPKHLEPRDFYTDTGLPSTGDKVLRGHLAHGELDENRWQALYELRLYRREKNKVLGGLARFAPRATSEKGWVDADGRIRATWNAHVTAVGRLSCSQPNLQNQGSRRGLSITKEIFTAGPGHILIGADLDQAHLRIIANYWGVKRLLSCFLEGFDPHCTLAFDIFGDRFKNAAGWGEKGFNLKGKPKDKTSPASSMREITKTFRYASAYWAEVPTVWGVLTSTENADGTLPYIKMTPAQVNVFNRVLHTAEPDWRQSWAAMVRLYDVQGYLKEPVMGRRSGVLSDGKKQEVVNYPILAAEASLMRIAEERVMRAFPHQFAGPGTGMIHQCHDSICVEVPLPKGFDPFWKPKKGEPLPPELERQRLKLEECMTLRIPGWPVVISAEADVGRTLADV